MISLVHFVYFVFFIALVLLYLYLIGYFKKCPYCKKRCTIKTPNIYACNYATNTKFKYGNVCKKCFKYNKDVKHNLFY